MTAAYQVRLKGEAPAAVAGNPHCDAYVRQSWSGVPVEPYGRVIPGYGDKYPYSADHIAVMLPGYSACTVVALDEIVGGLDLGRVPARSPDAGVAGSVYSLDNACGY